MVDDEREKRRSMIEAPKAAEPSGPAPEEPAGGVGPGAGPKLAPGPPFFARSADLVIATEQIEVARATVQRQLFSAAFQPIVEIRTQRVFGYEPLLRTQVPVFDGPLELFRAASAGGFVGELGRAFRRQAVSQCPREAALFLNIFPTEFDHAWLVRPDDAMFKHKRHVYLEITESVPLRYFEQCQNVLTELRRRGLMLAIDDLGAGFSNLKYIADLDPEIVKLDRELVAGVRGGTSQFRLLVSIVDLCHDMGAKVVAEGIETVAELAAAEEAGIEYVQGYLLARPANPPPPVRWPTELE